MDRVRHCARCRDFTEEELCAACANPDRDPLLCVVEGPVDVRLLEASTALPRPLFRTGGAVVAAGRRHSAHRFRGACTVLSAAHLFRPEFVFSRQVKNFAYFVAQFLYM